MISSAGLEEGLAVLGEEELHDAVSLALAGEAAGEGMASDLGVGRVGSLHRRRHDQLDRRTFDDGPFLARSSESRAAVVMKRRPSSVTR